MPRRSKVISREKEASRRRNSATPGSSQQVHVPERPHGEHQVGPCAEHLVGDPVLTQRRVCRLRLHDPPDLVDRRRIVLGGGTVPVWICATCANHYPEAPSPPGACVICSDERQWVPSSGQRWTTATSWPRPGTAATSARSSRACSGSGSTRRWPSASRRCWSAPARATCSGTRPATWTRCRSRRSPTPAGCAPSPPATPTSTGRWPNGAAPSTPTCWSQRPTWPG